MHAVIRTGGKQYLVEKGTTLKIEKLLVEPGKEVTFNDVLLVYKNKGLHLGTPTLKATVTGTVLSQGKGKKITIFKYKPKKRYQKKQGHRQPYTEVEITGIES